MSRPLTSAFGLRTTSIRRKLLVIFFGLATLPMLAISLQAYYRSVEAVERMLTEQSEVIVRSIMQQLRQTLAEPALALQALSQVEALAALATDDDCTAADTRHPACTLGTAALGDFFLSYRDSFSRVFLVPLPAGGETPPQVPVRFRTQGLIEAGGASRAYVEPLPQFTIDRADIEAVRAQPQRQVFRSGVRIDASGYVQRLGLLLAGDAGAVFADLKVSLLVDRAGQAQRLGRDGEALIVSDGVVLFHPDPALVNQRLERVLPSLDSLLRGAVSAAPITATVVRADGRQWLVTAALEPRFQWVVALMTPLDGFTRLPGRAAVINLAIATLSAALAFAAILSVIMRISSGLRKLAGGAQALAAGRLDTRIAVETEDEIGEVATCFNAMAAELTALIAQRLADERLREELRIGGEIQARVLPAEFPAAAAAQVWGTTRSAQEIGGDYFDVIATAPQNIELAIGDVSGKGVPAGLVMVQASTIIRSLALASASPAEVVGGITRLLLPRLSPNVFMSLLVVRLDSATGALDFAGAGHEHLLLYRRASGTVEAVRAGGTAIGIVGAAEARVNEGALRLALGDCVVLYTDGVVECRDAAGELYGRERLEACLAAAGQQPVRSLVESLLGDVDGFRGEAEQHDDMTLLAAKIGE